MRILLVYPPFLDPRLDAEDIRSAPIGLYYVAAALIEAGHRVEIIAWPQLPPTPDAVAAELGRRNPQLIGFSVLHANRWGAIEIARLARRAVPDAPVVFGGVGATHLWEFFLAHFPEVDYVVAGEGEAAMTALATALETGDRAALWAIPGLAFREAGRPVKNPAAPPAEDLDRLPMPARRFDLEHIALARGCPADCAFCGSPAFWGRRVRAHSADYFVDQMELLRRRGRRFVHVSDDTFTLDRRRAVAVCREIVRRRLDMTWTAISRVDAVDEETIAWMRRAGCIQISYGVESGSAAIRRRLGKRFSDAQVRRAFELTQRYGMLGRAYFIYGCPGEDAAALESTIALMRAIRPLAAVFYILDIYPGTALYADMRRRLGVGDEIWLSRVEDIMYFETDPGLDAAAVLEAGRRLREAFYTGLPDFVAALDPIDSPEFRALHADFFSRLAMTFDQGDYARVAAIPGKAAIAEALYRRALALHPDARAYLGLGALCQREGRTSESIALLEEGRGHFPDDPALAVCLAVSRMHAGRIREALALLERFPADPQARRLAELCRRPAGGRPEAL